MGLGTSMGYSGKIVDKLTNTILDQFADEDIKISNNILDLFDIGELPGTFTHTIILPGTKTNNAFFEHYYDISVYSPDIFNTNQKVEAYLDFDGFYLSDGYIQLNKVNVRQNKFIDSYEITLFGVISNFSVDSKSFFLTDLNGLSRYNHTSSMENISESWGRRLFDGDIVYPLAEYGQQMQYTESPVNGIDDYDNALTVQDFKPAIRVKSVWDEIFDSLGYTYSSSFWQQQWLEDVYLVCNRSGRTPIYLDQDIETLGQCKARQFGTSGVGFDVATSPNVAFSIPTNAIEYDYNTTLDLSTGKYIYNVERSTKLDCLIELSYYILSTGVGSGQPQWRIMIYDSTNTLFTQTSLVELNTYLQNKFNAVATTVSENQRYTTKFSTSILPPGKYEFRLEYSPVGSANFSIKLNPAGETSTELSITKVRQAADYRIMDIPSNMPFGNSGIRIIDFIRGIQKKYNLIIYPDKKNPRSFIVETFNTWYKDGDIREFNRFINLKDNIEVIPANNLAYKKLIFKDTTDNDYVTTIFKRANDRSYGEANFIDSGSYFSQGQLTVETVFSSDPLVIMPNTVFSGSAVVAGKCNSYQVFNSDPDYNTQFSYNDCTSGTQVDLDLNPFAIANVCSRSYPFGTNISKLQITYKGDCGSYSGGTPVPADTSYNIYVPTYISDDKYAAATVQPRLLFYNGTQTAPQYWIEGYTSANTNLYAPEDFHQWPYFDNYSADATTGLPTTGSHSLLFNNEAPSLGTVPTGSLITEYWNKWLGLLYNPRTRLVKCTGVIPLSEYIDIELNDIAEFRGNYYHVRAINDYNVKTGECNIELIGPIICDTISAILNRNAPPPPIIYCNFAATAEEVPAPSPTPSVTPTVTPSITVSVTPTVTPSASPLYCNFAATAEEVPGPSPSVTPTATPSVTPTPSALYCNFAATAEEVPGPSATPTPTPSITVSVTPTVTPSPSPLYCNFAATAEEVPGPSPSVTPTATVSSTPSVTPSLTPTVTPTVTPSLTPTPSPLYCNFAATAEEIPAPSATPSVTPSVTPSETPSNTPSITPSETPSETPSVTPSVTPSLTPTPSELYCNFAATAEEVPPPSPTPSVTPSATPPAQYINYLADKYECPSGNLVASGFSVVLPIGVTPVYDDFYTPSAGSGQQGLFVYQLIQTGGTGGLILEDSHSSNPQTQCSITP